MNENIAIESPVIHSHTNTAKTHRHKKMKAHILATDMFDISKETTKLV